METKVCATCKQTLCVTEFEFKDKKNNRRSSWCKTCTRAYKKRHYSKNKDRYLASASVSNHKRRFAIRRVVWQYLHEHPCVDCGECDLIVLEFDHRDPAMKKDTICQMITKVKPIREVLEEINKCDVRCANCHRRKTAKQCLWHEPPGEIVTEARRKYRSAKKEMQDGRNTQSCSQEPFRMASL